jgi:FkbM family methyltransferase
MLCNRHDLGTTPVLKEHGAWAWEEIESLQGFYGGIMLDIGANVGTHTLVYARNATHVFAFEPQTLVYHNLCANLLLNNVKNVTPVLCALGATAGYMQMKSFSPHEDNCPAGASLGRGDSLVPVRPLDALEIPKVDFIKIDVEGYELEVLQGATATLKRSHPTLYIEMHSPELIKRVPEFMQSLGYSSQPWCHVDIIGRDDYPDRIQYTEGYVFTWPER